MYKYFCLQGMGKGKKRQKERQKKIWKVCLHMYLFEILTDTAKLDGENEAIIHQNQKEFLIENIFVYVYSTYKVRCHLWFKSHNTRDEISIIKFLQLKLKEEIRLFMADLILYVWN